MDLAKGEAVVLVNVTSHIGHPGWRAKHRTRAQSHWEVPQNQGTEPLGGATEPGTEPLGGATAGDGHHTAVWGGGIGVSHVPGG